MSLAGANDRGTHGVLTLPGSRRLVTGSMVLWVGCLRVRREHPARSRLKRLAQDHETVELDLGVRAQRLHRE
jgi:hypothetical protein